MIMVVLALIVGFGAAMGIYFIEKRNCERTITQMQSVNLQNVYRLNEFKAVIGLDDNGNKTDMFYVKIPQALPLQVQLNEMAKALSEFCFAFLPVEVLGIQEYEGKKVAVINLREFEGFDSAKSWQGPSWAYGYFQGTAGGEATSTILIESFLQRDNPMPWIDGVVFLYEDHVLTEFEHVAELTRTSFRK